MQKATWFVSRLHYHRPATWHNLSYALRLRQYCGQPSNTTRQQPDYTALIDPSSLRNTLDAVREANRASLIKKVDQNGTISYLQSLATSEGKPKSQWLSDHSNLRASAESNDETSKEAVGDKGPTRIGSIKRVKLTSGIRHLEHAGLVLPVQSEWRATKGLAQRWRLPWLSHMNSAGLSSSVTAKERLAAEISAFNDYFTPKHPEKLASDTALDAIKLALTSIRPSYSIELMGSRVSGLANPLSDLDLNLKTADGARLDDVDDRTQAVKILANLNRDLRRHRWRRELRVTAFRRRARVPIIAGVHVPTGLAFQMQHTVTGYNSTEYARAFVKEYPTLRPLFITLKHMLTMRGLCDGQHGGLTSYPLLNMIVACLKLKKNQSDDRDVASHLLSFLDMYYEIDLSTVGISISPPGFIPLLRAEPRLGNPTQLDVDDMECAQDAATGISVELFGGETDSPPARGATPITKRARHFMYLVDPADPSNDLGNGVHMIKHIQATLIDVRRKLRQAMDVWEHRNTAGNLAHQQESLLECILEGDYKSFELDRATLQQSVKRRKVQDFVKEGQSENNFADSMRDWDI